MDTALFLEKAKAIFPQILQMANKEDTLCFLGSTKEFNLKSLILSNESRDSSVGIVLGYGLDDRGSRVRFLAGSGNFSLHHHIQNSSGAHPASYPMGTRVSFLGSKAAGA
jgi:hypothetical protein